MFYALDQAASLVTAKAALKNQMYYCPRCHHKVILRKGCCYGPHFAHVKQGCWGFSAGETTEHLQGKLLLARFFKASGTQVKTEAYLAEIRQRPDLVVQMPNKKSVAIEFQCAPLSFKRLCQRSRGYQRVGLGELWFLGSNYRLKRSLSQQVAQFMRWSKNCGFYLLYLNTIKECIEVIYAIQKADFLPLSYRCWQTTEIEKLKAFLQTPHSIGARALVLSEKKRQKQALARQIYYSKGQMYRLQRWCYMKKLDITKVLAFCGADHYAYPLYRTATLWWKIRLYCGGDAHIEAVAYRTAFISLGTFIVNDLKNFRKKLAIKQKNL